MSKLSNQDIRGIINQWKRRRPVREIAEYQQVTRQRIYQIISFYKKNRFYPYPRQPGRKPKPIPYGTETLVLTAHDGKIERFFGEVERRTPRFGSVERVVHWHNEIKPHCSLDYDEPAHAFWYRLPPERILGYAQRWMYAEGCSM